ncbi:sialate O-acetylesterase [Pedobacter changchengzhani]|uniref:Sialate O-acetylesterase n=1 Tax=Pedobacter changchengzhani TaxID=2529274 RepID=A0A4R5MLL9_9SPHI|nr:sialate O-acetylesterase [Pedobacter changchengzhani]TDG35999.1 sialate O-acetylesterase [Pedobacter changchengzhani]
MLIKFSRNFILLGLLILANSLYAKVKPAAIFTDHMVLQQRTEASLWGWAKPSAQVKVITSWNKQTYFVKANDIGKWHLKVKTPVAGGPYSISFNDGDQLILSDILIGEVWLCGGQSNMEMPMMGYNGQPILGSNNGILKSKNYNLRLYTVPRSSTTEKQNDSKPSQWKLSNPENVASFSATAYYYGALLNEILNVPIGLINDSYGGSTIEAWMASEDLTSFPEIKIPAKTDSIKELTQTPTTLYNGMIYPIIGYTIKGAIWYQGESNFGRSKQYEDLFPKLVSSWRKAWGIGEFPFYYVQIAPFKYSSTINDLSSKTNSAYLREAQRNSLSKINNSGMAVLMDIGEEKIIHPSHKQIGSERLAYLALAKTYNVKGIGYGSPNFNKLTIDKNKAVVSFENVQNGLTDFSKGLNLFELAGADHKFYPAKATIDGSNVMLTADEVKVPVAVRYAFKDFVVGDLFGNDGLPVSSFKTDDWDL